MKRAHFYMYSNVYPVGALVATDVVAVVVAVVVNVVVAVVVVVVVVLAVTVKYHQTKVV